MNLCKFGIHEWSEWYESTLNKYKWHKEFHLIRNCRVCQAQERVNFKKKDLDVLRAVDNSTVDECGGSDYNGIMKNIKDVFSIRKPERNKKIFELYKQGMTLEKIGKRFRISKQRVQVICYSQMRNRGIDKSTIDKKRAVCYTGVGK